MAVLCVLPARIASQRVPEKPLQLLAGRPLIEWSWIAASRVPGVDAVRVATDDERIADRVRGFGGTVVMTSPDHPSGTDRVAEVARSAEGRAFDVIVNFQADEPFLPAGHVRAAIEPVVDGTADIATLATPFTSAEEWNSEAEVKVARAEDGRALYFSRAGIPWAESGTPDFNGDPSGSRLRHLGLYVYSRPALEAWVSLPPSPLERLERLEQLRPLEAGWRIQVAIVGPCPGAIEEPEDLEWAEARLRTLTSD
ncbi:MAG: 3-deoxy-manno-octulosonate cytidylyltransferase [Gemmatimonadota bacterium]|jgi:3-deoxy-manno-octulosonate cytidylyltransferase (CMP-KDO synthetase)